MSIRLDGVDIAVSQGVSQFTGTMTVPLADDMLQSQMMTIEDLIESTDVSQYIHQCVLLNFVF